MMCHLILICRICSKCNKIRNSILMTNLLLVETQSTNLLLVRMSPHLIKPYKWHLYSRTMLLITTLCILPPTIKECTSNLYLVTLFKVNLPRFRITKVHTTINFSSTIIKLLTNPYTKLQDKTQYSDKVPLLTINHQYLKEAVYQRCFHLSNKFSNKRINL